MASLFLENRFGQPSLVQGWRFLARVALPPVIPIMHLFKKTPLACVLALFVVAAVHGACGQEQSFADANCALTPPPGWQPKQLKNAPHLVAAYSDPEGTRTLLIFAINRGKVHPVFNEAVAAEFDKGMEKGGSGPETSGRFVSFAGFDVYERRGTTAKSRYTSTFMLAIPTGDGLYDLQATCAKGEAADDGDIRKSLNSFRFLHPPGPPRAPRSTAYRIGYSLGTRLIVLVLFGVLGLIVWAIIKAASRLRPPMPAGFSGPAPQPQVSQADLPPPLPPMTGDHPFEPYEY